MLQGRRRCKSLEMLCVMSVDIAFIIFFAKITMLIIERKKEETIMKFIKNLLIGTIATVVVLSLLGGIFIGIMI